jgi:hypothetical protein
MLDMTRTRERGSRLSRLWRLFARWEAALNTDPIERLEERVSALERVVHGVRDHRASKNAG